MNIELKNKEAISKADITKTASDLLQQLDNGEISALALLQKFKAVSKIEEAIKSKLTEIAVLEASAYPKGECKVYGAEFKTTEAGTSYDYSLCGDTEWTELQAELADIKERVKDRETFLKAIKGSETCVDKSTAEIVTLYPPVKRSTTIVQCSIK